MTLSYGENNLLRLIFRWKGSVWKSVLLELTIWLVIFYVLRFSLEYGIKEVNYRDELKRVISTFDYYTSQLPVEILLVAYVSYALYRWWCQVELLPIPDDLITKLNIFVPQTDKEALIKRRLIARYVILSQVLAFRLISKQVAQRFPSMKHIVQAGLMSEQEFKLYTATLCSNIKWEAPLFWATNILTGSATENDGGGGGKKSATSSSSSPTSSREPALANAGVRAVVNEIGKFRSALQHMFTYDWIGIPLIYAQIVSFAVYGYFLLALAGHQTFCQKNDVYLPVLSIIQFIFYIGWLKVAESVTHPYGKKDDDLELNIMLDRNASVAMHLVDSFGGGKQENLPPLVEDEFFGRNVVSLPYTKASLKRSQHAPKSRVKVEVTNPGDRLFTETKLDGEEAEKKKGPLGSRKWKPTLKF